LQLLLVCRGLVAHFAHHAFERAGKYAEFPPAVSGAANGPPRPNASTAAVI
jgi:hypothetical protein